MRLTKRDCLIQMHHLAGETGLGLELEDATIKGEGRTRFNLFLVDENLKRIKQLNYPYQFTAKNLYHALRLSRDIVDATLNQDS